MEQKLQFLINGKATSEIEFRVNDTVLINFSRDIKNEEYCFTFINDNNYSSLLFTFVGNLPIDCYFQFTPNCGKAKFTGYHILNNAETEVDIREYAEFSIFIPRNKNNDVCTALTLTSLLAK